MPRRLRFPVGSLPIRVLLVFLLSTLASGSNLKRHRVHYQQEEAPVAAFLKTRPTERLISNSNSNSNSNSYAQLLLPQVNVEERSDNIPKSLNKNGVSTRMQAGMSKDVTIGKPFDMWCNLTDTQATIQSCIWTSNKENQLVGELLSGNACQLTINTLTKSHFGTWSCKVQSSQTNQFQQEFLTISPDPRVKENIRLPVSLDPVRYQVQLIPFIVVNNFTIEGHVEIEIDVVEATDNITLHLRNMTIYDSSVRVAKANGDELVITGHGYDQPREFYIIWLSDQLNANEKVWVNIDFLGDLNNELAGFYRSQYKDGETGDTKYLAVSQFESTDARRAFPCFDEPAMKAVFQISLGRLPEMTSISNMPILLEGATMDGHSDYVWDIYPDTPKMSTYLLAFIVSEFTFRQGQLRDNGVEFKIWSRNSTYDQTGYAAETGPKVLEYYESYFGVDFPLPKQDMIAIPDFSAGAMENWGLITYRETALLFEPGVSSLSDKEYTTKVISHELAHQWFGNLVTLEWWNDLWLNEGFASYVENIGSNYVEPEYDMLNRFVLNFVQYAFELDALESSHPISVEVNHPEEISEIFDDISYQKGASIIRMMATFLGVSNFNQGVTNYLQANQFGNANQDDLWQFLTDVAHQQGSLESNQSVKQIMDTWTLQKGYPVIHVKRNGQQITCSQEKFKFTQNNDDHHEYKWWVPISYTVAGGDFDDTNNKFWLTNEDTGPVTFDIVTDSSQPIIVNVQQTGFYRVSYDLDNWNKLSLVLKTNHSSIHKINRAQILNDVFSLAKADMVDYNVALDLTIYLEKEREYIPWSAIIGQFAYLKAMMKRTPAYGDLKAYLIGTLSPLYARLGFSSRPGDSHQDYLQRSQIVSFLCSLDYDPCEAKATEFFAKWMQKSNPDTENPVEPSLKRITYCTAVRKGDETEWNFLWQRYRNSNNANERAVILAALGCTQEIWLLQKYLEMTLDESSGVRTQDIAKVVSSVSNNIVGRYVAWNWLRNNWNTIEDTLDNGVMSPVTNLISYVTSDFNTELELRELQNFVTEQATNLGTAKKSAENSLDEVITNVQWMRKYYTVIVEWLHKQEKVRRKRLSFQPFIPTRLLERRVFATA